MSLFPKQIFLLIALFTASVALKAGVYPRLEENKGQWDKEVHFKALSDGGYFYLTDHGLRVQQLENNFLDKFHRYLQGDSTVQSGFSHAIDFEFLGADLSNFSGKEDLNRASNYFIGNDQRKHAKNARSFKRAVYSEAYEGVDIHFDIKSDRLKYAFHISPGADPNQVKMAIRHAEAISLKDGRIVISTSVGQVFDAEPFVYQLSDLGRVEKVAAHYILKGEEVSFAFPEGYDASRELIVDPEISFSTYIGAFDDNFGFTASYDDEGHLYSGAIAFGAGYPTVGAFQDTFGGGNVDCALTKFSPEGTNLIYSTFLGGSDTDTPHSLVVNSQGELYVLGTTSSLDFPTSFGAYQPGFAGGSILAGLGFQYINGSDIFISRLSADGSELLSSTYVGGSGNDGVGLSDDLNFNYGDIFRGEIVLDEEEQVNIASVTGSADFPYLNGFSPDFSSISNGAVFSLSADLSQLNWSTSVGGSIDDAAYGLQISNDGTIYVTGGTTSTNLVGAENGADPNYTGAVDGFIMRITADGSAVLNSTYIGTTQFDQTYFVQIDNDGDVYVIGQSLGNVEVSDDVYFNAGGRQFVQKYNAELTQLEWSTRVGSNISQINFSPSAFLVSDCDDIYISGWGGTTNSAAGAQAGGNTFGLPVTDDAFQPNTDGSDFYLMVLDEDALDLEYATYFGGNTSAEHVDGGTSRFDKNGTVYQAVCAGCGGNNDFPSQPGVWSPENLSTNCNLGVFKFRLASVSANAEVNFSSDVVCANQEIELINLSQDANQFLWDFGDGTTSTDLEPTHSYDEPGTYTISLLAEDGEGCLGPDSTSIEIEVLPGPELAFEFENTPVCIGDPLVLGAVGAEDYEWSPEELFDNNTLANPTFTGTETTEVSVTGSTSCGAQTIEVTIEVNSVDIQVEEEVVVCPGESAQLNASGGGEYVLEPATFLNDPNIANPISTPNTSLTYEVTAISDIGCENSATVDVIILDPPPELEGETDYASCNAEPVQLEVSGGENYSWFPTVGLSNANIPNPLANPSSDIIYTVTSSNQCGESTLEILVRTESIDIELTTDTIGCFLTPIAVSASGGDTYRWSPEDLFSNPNAANTSLEITGTTEISVIGFNEDGCFDVKRELIRIFPRAPVILGPDKVIAFGGEALIEAFSPLPIVWESSPFLSCLNCSNPVAAPPETMSFFATVETEDGCIERDSVVVTVSGNLYIPNAFTPDGDGINDIFKAQGIDIEDFRMEIFNRWGELIFESNSMDIGWNGSSPNEDYYAPADVYPYRIVATEHTGEVFEYEGTVNLIR